MNEGPKGDMDAGGTVDNGDGGRLREASDALDALQLNGEAQCGAASATASSSVSAISALGGDPLADRLDSPGRYSLCELLAAVLALDFLAGQSYNREFCTWAVSSFAKHVRLPEKVAHALLRQMHVCAEGGHGDWPRPVTDVLVEVRSIGVLRERGAHALLADMVALYVAQGVYDSRSRSLTRHVAALLGVGCELLDHIEDGVAHLLVEETYVESEHSIAARKRKERRTKIKRWALVGATGAVGGVLIGLTGGLAAPMVAAGAGVVVGGAAAGLATTAGAAVIGTLFGVGGAGLAGYKMSRRVGALQEFIVETLTDGQTLHAAIAVSGWITRDDSEAFRDPWRHLRASAEQYTIRYESKHLLELGQAMDYFMTSAVTFAIHQTLMETALAGLVTAIAWPAALLGVASALDNPWSVCVHRASAVGAHLAELLLRRQHGRRPVSLLGYGLGARVIYHCLAEMQRRPDAHGIIDNVYLLGAPVAGSTGEWNRLSSIVGGRLVNGYCRKDWLLKFLYRTMNAQFSIAGTAPVPVASRNAKIVNVNLSHIVNGHLDYGGKLRECLDVCGVRVAPRRDESQLFEPAAFGAEPPKSGELASTPVEAAAPIGQSDASAAALGERRSRCTLEESAHRLDGR